MINAIQNCYSFAADSIYQVTQFTTNTLNKTITFIAKYHLHLFACALACAVFHDYVLIVLYGVIGGVFYSQVPELEKTVNDIYLASFLVFKPITDCRIFNRQIFKKPVHGLVYLGGSLSYIWLNPISSLLAEAYICIRCGAAFARACRDLVARQAQEDNPMLHLV